MDLMLTEIEVLWKENYVVWVWITLEPWLNAYPLHVPDMCKI